MSTIGILGGGIGGLAAALALHRAGHEVAVFEQAQRFGRVGADINLTPNAVRALDGLGAGAEELLADERTQRLRQAMTAQRPGYLQAQQA